MSSKQTTGSPAEFAAVSADDLSDPPSAQAMSDRRVVALAFTASVLAVLLPMLTVLLRNVWIVLLAPVAVVIAGLLIISIWRTTVENHQQTESRLRALSVTDELTGCNNRTGARLLGDQLLHTVRRRGDAIHAFMIDVSHLTKGRKELDDATAGEVMISVAEAVRASTRGTDVVSRWDSRRFLVLGPGSGVHPGELEHRVRSFLVDAPPVPVDVWPCRVTVGHSTLAPWDGGDLDTLVDRAEQDFELRKSIRSSSAPEAFFTRAPSDNQ